MKREQVYTIIVTYNGMQWLDTCIKSIENQSHVIVVDNNSTDGTVDFIEKNFPEVMLLKQSQNLGFGKANNIGFSYALKNKAEYVFLMNQDVYVDEETILKLVEVSKLNPAYGILSPLHYNGTGATLDKYFEFCACKNDNFKLNSMNNVVPKIYDVPIVNAAAWFMPVKVLKEVGGFDPIFFHYGEDQNYCQRLLFHNYKIGIVTETKIRHDRESRAKNSVMQFSEDYYKNYKIQLKVNSADILFFSPNRTRLNQKKKYVKLILKACISLNFNALIGYIKQYKCIDPVFSEIMKSRDINIKKGKHYIA